MWMVLVALAAYAITGVHYVWRDMREPPWNRPAYVSQGTSARLFMVVYWLPGTIFSTYLRGPLKRHIYSWLLFAGAVALGCAIIR